VLILEAPSAASRQNLVRDQRGKQYCITNFEKKKIVENIKVQERKRRREVRQEFQTEYQRRKKKAKGPNPLSCKKKSIKKT